MLKNDPNNLAALLEQADAYIFIGDYNNCIMNVNKLLEMYPNEYILYMTRGIAFYCKGDLENARKDFQKAKELGGKDAQRALDILK